MSLEKHEPQHNRRCMNGLPYARVGCSFLQDTFTLPHYTTALYDIKNCSPAFRRGRSSTIINWCHCHLHGTLGACSYFTAARHLIGKWLTTKHFHRLQVIGGLSFTSAERCARDEVPSSKNGEIDPALLGLKVTGFDGNNIACLGKLLGDTNLNTYACAIGHWCEILLNAV